MVDRNGSILLRGIGEPADESVFGARNRHCILCNLISMRPEETHSMVCQWIHSGDRLITS